METKDRYLAPSTESYIIMSEQAILLLSETNGEDMQIIDEGW